MVSIIFFYILVLFHTQNITKYFKEKINFTVELTNDLNDQSKTKLINTISKKEGVIQGSIQFISKKEALSFMSEQIGEILLEGENPFSDIILFNVEESYFEADHINLLESEIEELSGVDTFYNQTKNFGEIKSKLVYLQIAMLVLALIFIFLGMIILQNTIKALIDKDKLLIKNMEFVGAKTSFIKRPFLRRTQWVLYRSYVLGLLLILLSIFVLSQWMPWLWSHVKIEWLISSAAIAVLLTMIVTRWSTHIQMDKYLSKNLYELYY